MNKLSSISIVICCYNSVKLLPNTLLHLSKQKVDTSLKWEIIVVNNNSRDHTRELAAQLAKEHLSNIPFKIIDEPRAGLSNAREAGINASENDIIIFCDDDNWLSENYVQIAAEIMSGNESIGILGGKNSAAFEVEEPAWFNMLESTYAVGEHQYPNGDVTESRGRIFGAGMVIRKSIWKEIKKQGFQNLLTDRMGKKLSTGGDTELCYQCRLLGYKLFYDDRIQLTHFMPSVRLQWAYCRKLQRGIGESLLYLSIYHYLLDKQKSELSPKSYYRQLLKKEIKFFFSSFKRLYFFFFKDIEGEYYLCNYEYSFGKLKTALQLGTKKYVALVKQTEESADKINKA